MGKQTIHGRQGRIRTGSGSAAPGIVRKSLVKKAAEKPGIAESKATRDAESAVLHEERNALIAQAAYFRAERRGFEAGHELEDWLAAEQDIERALPVQGASNIEAG